MSYQAQHFHHVTIAKPGSNPSHLYCLAGISHLITRFVASRANPPVVSSIVHGGNIHCLFSQAWSVNKALAFGKLLFLPPQSYPVKENRIIHPFTEVQTPYTVGLLGGYSSEYHRRVSNYVLLPTPSLRVLKGRATTTSTYYLHHDNCTYLLIISITTTTTSHWYLLHHYFSTLTAIFSPFNIYTSCQSRPYFMSNPALQKKIIILYHKSTGIFYQGRHLQH